MDDLLSDQVRRRAGGRCEYCHLPENAIRLLFQMDHIIAQQHEGPTILANLAWSCLACNKRKGPNLAGLDNRKLVPLFHPRRHKWSRHFRWEGPLLMGRTSIGRATIRVLGINDPFAVELRRTLIEEGIFPGPDE
jgi:hypothetical protein